MPINRSTIQSRNSNFIAGIQKYLQSVPNMVIAGTTYTPAGLIKLFQSQIDSANKVAASRAQWRVDVQADLDLRKQLRAVVTGFVSYVRNLYSDTGKELADFGISPKKVAAPLTSDAKALAAERRAATRVARHTMGKKQKKTVKGSVPEPAPIPAAHAGTPGTTAASSGASTGTTGNGGTPHA